LKLRHKIAIFAVIIQTLLIVSITVENVRTEVDRSYASMSSYAKMMAKVIAGRWISDIINKSNSRNREMENFIDVVMSFDNRIACIAITDEKKNVIAGDINSRWVDFGNNKKAALAELLGAELKHKGFKSVSVDIETDRNVIGRIKIIFSLSYLKKQIFDSVVKWSLVGLSFIVIGIAGAFFVSKKITDPLSRVIEAMGFVEAGNLEHKVSIKTKDEVGRMAVTFNKMVEGLKERDFVKDTFSKYVSKQVADRILKEKDYLKLRGEKRIVTVFFADIRGFTPLAESMPPEKVLTILNEYFSVMIETVLKYNGVPNKFIGDAIMVTYNAPLDQKYHELKAILTGIEIQEKIGELNKKRLIKGEPQINIGIGINTGEAVAGNVGSSERLEYTVIGSGVNLAQRIESSTEKGKLHISETTYNAVKDYVDVIKLEPVVAKGISEPVQLYAVINARIPEGFYEND
jgi:class 3 adenylate cyclase